MTLKEYFAKWKGRSVSPPTVIPSEMFWSFLGSMLGIGAVAWAHWHLALGAGLVLLIGSFGATAVLLYGAPGSPLAQPRNLLGGHFLSAWVGVACFKFLPGQPELAAALAVSLAITLMHLTKTLHPPGGATALIAVLGPAPIHALGWWYPWVPALSGASVMLLVALVVNNFAPRRRYPEFWL
ncbi:MAG: HPP family protein [bacterium]|nr:HPP family protein [bacterium]